MKLKRDWTGSEEYRVLIKKTNNNNKNNNGGDNGPDRFGPGGAPPRLLTIQDFLDGGPALLPQRPTAPINLGNNLFNTSSTGPVPPPRPNFNFFENVPTQHPSSFNNPATGGTGNDLFGSQAATAVRESETKIKTQAEVDDFLYELPDDMPELELGDGLVQTLGTEAEDLFDPRAPPTKKEEEDEILKNLMDEYSGEDIKDTMDETGQVPESIYFFYGGEIEQFVNALEFIGLSPINREFSAFLLYDLGRQTMTQNKLSIHVESGDIFYDNHNTRENFYSFLLSQQNDEAAYVPKKFSYRNSIETYISTFLQDFSIDDQEKFDLLAFKNSKYLFYHFNDFVKTYGNPRYKLLHTRKMLDTVGMKKVEEKNK